MADDKVIIGIELDDGSVKTVFSSLAKNAKESSKEASSELSSILGSSFTKLGLMAAGAGAAIGAALFSKASVRAAMEAEAGIQRMNQSLANAGRYSEETSKSFQNLAAEIQRTTTIEDDTVFSLAALANNFAKTDQQAQNLTKAAIELSAATGKDLSSSVEILGKTLSGSAGLLSKQIPELQGFTKEQLKAGAAIDAVLSRFGGSAASQVNTFSGALSQAKNAFGDMQEELGNFIVKDKVVVALIKSIADSFNAASSSISEFRTQGEGANSFIGKAIILTVKFAEAINTWLIAPLEIGFNIISVGAKSVITAITAIFTAFYRGFSALANTLPSVGPIKTIQESLSASQQEWTNLTIAQYENLSQSAEKTFEVDFAGSTAVFLEDLRTKLENANELTNEFKNNTNSNFSETAVGISISVESMKSTIANGMSSMAMNMGKALQSGQNLFESFGNGVVNIIADMIISVGNALIMQGIAIETFVSAINSLLPGSGMAAAAAGLGLVMFGSALKASVGGGGGSSSIPTPGTPGGSPLTTQPMTDTPLDQTVEDRAAQNDVTVNIRGDVLDSDETGLRIVDIINSAFDKQGVVIKRGVTA